MVRNALCLIPAHESSDASDAANRDLASAATLQKTSVPSVPLRVLRATPPPASRPTPTRPYADTFPYLGVSRRNSFGPILTRTTLKSFCFSIW
jgi:hypothetical protein